MILKAICTKSTDYDKIIKQAGKDNLSNIYGWYFHGDLEKNTNYDIGTIYNMSEFPSQYKETLNWHTIINDIAQLRDNITIKKAYLNGIYFVEVYGIDEPCIGYFWTVNEHNVKVKNSDITFPYWNQRGLVCLVSDQESCKYAKECYKQRKEFL